MFTYPVIVLAAGQSRRMRGADKLLEDVGGQPLLRRQAGIAQAATTGAVIVALPPAPHPRHDALAGLDVTTLPVPDAAEGMNASLRAGVAALPSGTPAAMVLLADLPELTTDDLIRVGTAFDPAQTAAWRGTTEDGKPGHPIVFAARLFPQLLALQGDSGGREVVGPLGDAVGLVPLPEQRARLDLDTPEAWAAWRARD
ncbi:MAG: 4-diphosphocytidyl-2C-methyl-D-erythritol synthase [Pseudooceanicola sp.]|nr:4-diphosphocytidyl-2C-methyl-D-erythritol synthase [Pseudooceanicola sp.]